MRTVKARNFRDYFRKNGMAEYDYAPGIDWDRSFYKKRTRFNRQWVVLFLLISFLVLGFYLREGWVLLFTSLITLTALFFRTRAIAEGLYLSRIVQSRAKKGQKIEFEYELRNASEFETSSIWVRDFFTGTQSQTISFKISEGLDPLSIRKIKSEVWCNSGMGVHRMGPLVLTLTDPMGIFEFTITEDAGATLEILPQPLLLNKFEILDALDSNAVGVNEGVRSGQSSNFLGLREYVPGDPIKRINWKLSARHKKLVVNVFENMVHTDLTVCIDMDCESHIGRVGDNTWEMCKEAAVAILQDLQPRTHRIQLCSQEVMLLFDRGNSHLIAMNRAVSTLKPIKPDASSLPLLRKILPSIPYGSSLVYITPVYLNNPGEISKTIEGLQEKAVRSVVVLVQALDYIQTPPPGLATSAINEMNRSARQTTEQIIKQNEHHCVPTYLVLRSRALNQSLSKTVFK